MRERKAYLRELARRGVFCHDPSGQKGAPVCWYSGLRLTADAPPHFAVTAEHLIPHTWGFGQAMCEPLRKANLVPAAAYINNIIGCLPTVVKWDIRGRLRSELKGRVEPCDQDRGIARAALTWALRRHGLPDNFTPVFSTVAWMGARPALYRKEREFLERAGVDLDALIAATPKARILFEDAVLATMDDEPAPRRIAVPLPPQDEALWERPWLRWV